MKFWQKSIQNKILIWGGLSLLFMAIILIAYSAVTLFNTTVAASERDVSSAAESVGDTLKADVNLALDSARTTAQMFKAVRTSQIKLTREQASLMLKQVLEDNPAFLGTYTLWEPDAFDFDDASYKNKEGYDSTGRLIPYWARGADGSISVSALVDYETVGAGDWYLIPKQTKTESVVGPLLYPIGNETVLMTSQVVPIVVNNTFYGIAGVDLKIDRLQEQLDAVDLYNHSAEVIMVNNDGLIAGVSGKPELAGTEMKEYLTSTWREDLGYVQSGTKTLVTRDGVVSVFMPVQLGNTTKPWGVIINVPLSAITAEATRGMWTMIGIGIAAMLVGLALLWFAGWRIAKPIRKITEAAQVIATGDLSQEIDLHSEDEVGQLADAFRKMSSSLKGKAEAMETVSRGDLTVQITAASEKDILSNALAAMVIKLRQSVSQVAESAANLGNASNQLATASREAGMATNQISTTIQQVAKGITQQSESISRTAASVEQMGRAIDSVTKGAQEQTLSVAKASEMTSELSAIVQNVADQAEQQAKNADHTVTTSRESAEIVANTVKGMESIRSRVGLSSEKVTEMGKRSEQIGAIVETIEDIASQTNLLALNAAIEAARAGEHGKGFAVVADEVRKLAEKSAAATREIGGLIQAIQKTVNEAIRAMEESTAEVENGVGLAGKSQQSLESILQAAIGSKRLAQEVADAASKMSSLANNLTGAMDSVSAVVEENTAATEEMSANSDEVTRAIENIASVSEENSASVEEVSASSEEMSAQVEEVNASAQELSEMAEKLRKVVSQFKLE